MLLLALVAAPAAILWSCMGPNRYTAAQVTDRQEAHRGIETIVTITLPQETRWYCPGGVKVTEDATAIVIALPRWEAQLTQTRTVDYPLQHLEFGRCNLRIVNPHRKAIILQP